ncbi:MAG: response regulator [Lewinella sp.]
MLIDDSETDNFIHSRRLKKMELSDQIVIRKDGREGLAYLTEADLVGRPDLLFLDINMPVMDGWEFLDAYQQLADEKRARVTIVMLTSSVGDTDYSRAHSYETIDGHIAKPLTEEKINALVSRYFSS